MAMSKEHSKFVATLFVCPHQWSEPERRMVRHIIKDEGRTEEYEADVYVCALCGINRVQKPGSDLASMFPPQSRQEGP